MLLRGLSLAVVSGDYSLVAMCGLLVVARRLSRAWASVAAAPGLGSCGSRAPEHRLGSWGAQASVLHGTWGLAVPGVEPTPALAGRFFTIEPPGKPGW